MANTTNQTQELRHSAQQIFLAGLGALSKAEEEGTKLFSKLVKKGQSYDGPGSEQARQIRQQIELQLDELAERAAEVQKDADKQAGKVKRAVDDQMSRARAGVDNVLEGIEDRIEKAVTTALHGLGVPTRDEFNRLEESLSRLAKNLDAARRERKVQQASAPDIEARATGNGWYEVRVHGVVVDKVRGEEAATARVKELRAQDFSAGSQAGEVSIEATGGGWYEVRVDGVAVDKVQGRRAADAAVTRLEQQA
jgi:poly(hydroxyalkanoate) granule-associated protein